MQPDKLVMMANQIAIYFAAQPGTDQAECVAAHINDFWEPRMRETLSKYYEDGGADLLELAKEAMKFIRVPADKICETAVSPSDSLIAWVKY